MVKRYRMEQVNELLRQEIGKIIAEKVRDPRVQMVTVTGVDTSRDLHHARVYISVLEEQERLEPALEGLRRASGFIRKTLMDRINIRYTPDLTFLFDHGVARGDRVSRVLRQLREAGEIAEDEGAESGE